MNPSVWLQACRVEHNRLSWYIRDTSWGGLPEGRDSKCWSFSLFSTYFVNWIKSFFSKHSRLTWILWYTLKSIASSHKHGWCQYKQEGGCFPNKVHPCWQRLSYKKIANEDWLLHVVAWTAKSNLMTPKNSKVFPLLNLSSHSSGLTASQTPCYCNCMWLPRHEPAADRARGYGQKEHIRVYCTTKTSFSCYNAHKARLTNTEILLGQKKMFFSGRGEWR